MLKRVFAVIVLLVLGAGVAVAVLAVSEEEQTSETNVDRLIADKASVRTLSEEITISGEMRREELQSINSVSSGRMTALEVQEGDTVEASTMLFALDGRPSIAVNGEFSFYRELDVGAQGLDVKQLETILDREGYEVGVVDQFYTEETRNGLALWQEKFGFKGGVTEVDELVNFSLISNPQGYKVGAVNSIGVTIGSPLSDQINGISGRQGTAVATEEIPVVTLSASPSVVLEGGKVAVEITADPSPAEEIEIGIGISGDVLVGEDYEENDSKFLIPAGSESVIFELEILADEELEANEDLKISILGGFENNEEQELVDEQIISGSEAWDYDFTASEAQNLLDLKESSDDAARDYRNGSITAAARTKAQEAYEEALEKAKEDRTETEQEEFERLIPLLNSKTEELRVAKASRWILGETDSATVVIDDPDAPDAPVLVIASSSDYVKEPGVALFYVETTDELAEDLIVFFEVEGDVTPAEDYIVPAGDVTIPKGSKRGSISIEIRDDDLVEVDELLNVRLLEDKNSEYQLSSQREAAMMVESPDLPEMSIEGGGTILEGETSVITVRADQAVKVDTSINYSVSGTAQQGIDYEVLNGSALMKAGESSVEIPIRSLRDDVFFLPGDMIVAEWPARVGKINFEKEDFISSGAEILSLTEPVFKVILFASPTDRAKLEVGQKVTIEMDAGDQNSDGVISQLDDAAKRNGASELYEGEVEAFEDLVAVEGAVVTLDVVVSEVIDAIVVPIAAVLTEGSLEKVRVVTREGTIERRVVQTGMLEGAWVEIISGVSPEEFVIIEIDRP